MRVTLSDNGITNAIEVAPPAGAAAPHDASPPAGTRLLLANNDDAVRLFDVGSWQKVADFGLPWACNYATLSPNRTALAVVGDDPAALLLDPGSGRVAARLKGHADYSFAAAWHPGGVLLATGNQASRASGRVEGAQGVLG